MTLKYDTGPHIRSERTTRDRNKSQQRLRMEGWRQRRLGE
jgi:hypothetical protein